MNKFLKAQADAAKRTGYGPIWLRREGDWVIVEVSQGEHWFEVIRELYDGNFSHIVEPLGIEARLPEGEKFRRPRDRTEPLPESPAKP
jgi:hypothetical protein